MALRATRTERRRQAREQEVTDMNELLRDPDSGPDWQELRPVLDDAMHELNERDRLAVLLRFFRNKSLREVGLALGLSENAARMCVERSLDKLRTQLARRGVTSSGAALALALTTQAVTAAPPVLVATLTATSLAGSATTATAFSTLKFMAMTHLKTSVIAAVAVIAVGTPLLIQHHS